MLAPKLGVSRSKSYLHPKTEGPSEDRSRETRGSMLPGVIVFLLPRLPLSKSLILFSKVCSIDERN